MPKMLYLSQRDPRWATKTIGRTKLTVGRWGCTITCISMLSSYYGCYKSPAELAALPWLFNGEGKLIWEQLSRAFGGKIKFEIRRYGMDRRAIAASVLGSPKTAVLLEVANKSHWVVATGTYGNDFYCVDPIDARKKLALRSFQNITGSAHVVSG